MTKHITPDKLEKFLHGELTGDESVEVLLHLETCDECQSHLPQENPREVISRLLSDEQKDNSTSENSRKLAASTPPHKSPKKSRWEKMKSIFLSKKIQLITL